MNLKFKRSSTVGAIPTISDIEVGGIAINFPDGKIYTRDSSDNIIELATADNHSHTNDDLPDDLVVDSIIYQERELGSTIWEGMIDGDYYIAVNAYYDDVNLEWNRQDENTVAWLYEINQSNNMVNEGYKANNVWRATPDTNPIASKGSVGGWLLCTSISEFGDFTLGGNGVEVDGHGTVPYGRLLHSTVNGFKYTGLITNVYLDFSGRDDTNEPSLYAGFIDDGAGIENFKIQRSPSGASLSWSDLFTVTNAGNVSFSGTISGNGFGLTNIPWSAVAAPSSLMEEGENVSLLNNDAGYILKSTYDPQNVSGDAFSMDNMIEGTTTKIFTDTERTKLSGVESGATADQTDAEIESAYNNQVGVATQTIAEEGTSTLVWRWTAQRVKQTVLSFLGKFGIGTDNTPWESDLHGINNGQLFSYGAGTTINLPTNADYGEGIYLPSNSPNAGSIILTSHDNDKAWLVRKRSGTWQTPVEFVLGSANTESVHAHFYDSTGNQDVSTSEVTLAYDSSLENSGEFSNTSGEITYNGGTELFLVNAQVTTKTDTGTRDESQMNPQFSTDGGQSWSNVPGAHAMMYNRDTTRGETTGSSSFLITLNSGDMLRVRVSGEGSVQTKTNGSRITILSARGGSSGPIGPAGGVDSVVGNTGNISLSQLLDSIKTGLIHIDRTGEILSLGGDIPNSDTWIRLGNHPDYSNSNWLFKYVGSTTTTGGNELRFESGETGKYYQFDHDGNFEYYDGSSTITLRDGNGLHADTLGSYSASISNTGNTVVVRDNSGDIQSRLFRSEYGITNTNINYIPTQRSTGSGTDNYFRPSTPAQFRAAVTDAYYAGSGHNHDGSYVQLSTQQTNIEYSGDGGLIVRTNNNNGDFILDVRSSGQASRFQVEHNTTQLKGAGDGKWYIGNNKVLDETDVGTAANRDVTISTSNPSGGSDGDLWFKV